MKVDKGFMCGTCNKIYHREEQQLPHYCTKCGEDLVERRYWYNLMEYHGEVVETRDTNMFGGYDYVKTILSPNAIPVKIRRKFLKWELFSES